MSTKKILGGSILLTLAAAAVVAILAVSTVAVTPSDADAAACFPLQARRAWGHGSSCAAALADLNAQAAALCNDCPWAGSCGAGPSVTNKTTCYYANGKWTIDADISNSCSIDRSCLAPENPGL